MEVYGMLAPQSSLARPRILLRVLGATLKHMLIPSTSTTNNIGVLSAETLAQLHARPTANTGETV
jgi:hypothetical protein